MTRRGHAIVVVLVALVLVAAVAVGARVLRPEAPSPGEGEVTGIVYSEPSGFLSALLGSRDGLVAEVGIDVLNDFASEGERLDLSREEVTRRIDTSRYRTRTGDHGAFTLEPAPGPAIVCAQTAAASGCVEMDLQPPMQLNISVEDDRVVVASR